MHNWNVLDIPLAHIPMFRDLPLTQMKNLCIKMKFQSLEIPKEDALDAINFVLENYGLDFEGIHSIVFTPEVWDPDRDLMVYGVIIRGSSSLFSSRHHEIVYSVHPGKKYSYRVICNNLPDDIPEF